MTPQQTAKVIALQEAGNQTITLANGFTIEITPELENLLFTIDGRAKEFARSINKAIQGLCDYASPELVAYGEAISDLSTLAGALV